MTSGAAGALADRYELGEILAEGSTSALYRARDLRTGEVRAVKVLSSPLLAHEGMRARFMREARVMSSFRHENIVPVLDWGVDEGSCWLVMELIEGGSLQQRLDLAGPVPPRQAAMILQRMALALHHAHVHGIAHRDFNPGNVLLAEDGTPRLVDFGLARPLDPGSDVTGARAVMGTPGFMAPEQLVDSRNVDNRADVYAAGATLCAVITGRRPGRLFDLDLDSPPFRELPPPLARVAFRATRYQPEDRYPTASRLAAALGHVLVVLPSERAEDEQTAIVVRGGTEAAVVRRHRSFDDLEDAREAVGRPRVRRLRAPPEPPPPPPLPPTPAAEESAPEPTTDAEPPAEPATAPEGGSAPPAREGRALLSALLFALLVGLALASALALALAGMFG